MWGSRSTAGDGAVGLEAESKLKKFFNRTKPALKRIRTLWKFVGACCAADEPAGPERRPRHTDRLCAHRVLRAATATAAQVEELFASHSDDVSAARCAVAAAAR